MKTQNAPQFGISNYFLLIVIPIHIAILGAFFFYQEYTWMHLAGTLLIYTAFGGFGLELTFHRMISHHNFSYKYSWMKNLFVLWGSLACQGSLIAWTALHRNHHVHVDTDLDHQAPKHGLWSSYIGWTVNPSLTQKIKISLVRDLLRNPYYLFLDKYYYVLIYATHLAIAIISPSFYFLAFLPGTFLSFHVSSINNLIGHNLKIGQRPFKVDDWSTDVWWAALFSWGISFQNTHHHDPMEINYGKHSGIDPGFYLYQLIASMGWVKRNV